MQLEYFKYTIMKVAINSDIYQQASAYAHSRGLNLTEVIENYLVRFIERGKGNVTEQSAPDVVLSLLGAGEPVAENDLNAREAYQQYLEENTKS